MKQITWIILGGLIFVISAYSYANDSLARVGAGGLTLLKTDNIQMVQEILEISPTKIRVHYRFLNESKQDIKTIVAFPMPPYGFNPGFSAGRENEKPLEDFHVWVDGKELETKTDRVATSFDGIDITDNLRKIGLSDEQIFETFGDCDVNDKTMEIKCGLSEHQEAAIAKLINERRGENRWKVAETAYWEQAFPAGKEIEVVHEYKPFVGMRYSYYDIPSEKGVDVCMDSKTLKAIANKHDKSHNEIEGKDPISLGEVEYILGTGRNWKGPIGNFKLIIKKELPGDIVSLCFPGKPLKASPTTIEFSQVNYIPQDKLIVFFYSFDKNIRNSNDR